tara:strand:+ start:1384 stop:1908 length:525 start_codon:yes stop_codon:yes gene_type:complete
MTSKDNFIHICNLTTNVMGLRKGSLADKSRKKDLHLARTIAGVIGMKEGIKREVIAKQLNRHRTAIYHYEKQHNDWFSSRSYPSYAKAYTKVFSAYQEIEDSRKQFVDKFHLRNFVKELGLVNCDKKHIVFTITSGSVSYQLFSDAHNFSTYYDTLKLALSGYKAILGWKEYEL